MRCCAKRTNRILHTLPKQLLIGTAPMGTPGKSMNIRAKQASVALGTLGLLSLILVAVSFNQSNKGAERRTTNTTPSRNTRTDVEEGFVGDSSSPSPSRKPRKPKVGVHTPNKERDASKVLKEGEDENKPLQNSGEGKETVDGSPNVEGGVNKDSEEHSPASADPEVEEGSASLSSIEEEEAFLHQVFKLN